MTYIRHAILVATLATAAFAQDVSQQALTQAGDRSVGLLQQTVAQWKLPCFSCHHQALPAMALDSARRHGLKVDETLALSASNRAFAFLASIDDSVQDRQLIDPAMSEGMSLVAAFNAGVEPSINTAIFARRLASVQKKDGHWATIDARPPQSNSLFTATAVGARAISLFMPSQLEAEKRVALDRARSWLSKAQPVETEDRVFQLLGLFWTGAGESELRKLAAGLVAMQTGNGGWPQMPSAQPDAYATAQALYVLQVAAGMPASDAVVRRGLAFLLQTQQPDGSWKVGTRIHTPAPMSPPYFDSGFPYGRDQWVSAMATAWAVMAIAEALPAVERKPLPVTSVRPKGEAPWMATALFEPVDKLEALLKTGLPANSTAPEGTTLLMMSAHDPAKVRLLLNRGANAKQRSASGYDSLMIAALFPGNLEAARLLIAKGLSPKARKGVSFDASALPIATLVGDAAMMGLLMKHGADPGARMKVIGAGPVANLTIATWQDDVEAIRVLVRNGVTVDELDGDRMTALSWAALEHKTAAARALLELGANPKHKDKFGLTPREHVHGIRFPDDGLSDLFADPKH